MRGGAVRVAPATMRTLLLAVCAAVLCCAAAAPAPAPQRSRLQLGDTGGDSQPFVEEVVVESVLNVRTPSASRQARTNTRTSLQTGTKVAEMKNTN